MTTRDWPTSAVSMPTAIARSPGAKGLHRQSDRGLETAVRQRLPRCHRGRTVRSEVTRSKRPARGKGPRSPRWSPPPSDCWLRWTTRRGAGSVTPSTPSEWQTWANPEFMQFDTGLRLEFQPAAVQQRRWRSIAASLSTEGYRLAHEMMLINGFLGDVVGLPTVLNEFSYNVALYGTPDPVRSVGLAAVRPPLCSQLPGRRGPDGARPGLPRRRTQRDRRRSARRRCAPSTSGSGWAPH